MGDRSVVKNTPPVVLEVLASGTADAASIPAITPPVLEQTDTTPEATPAAAQSDTGGDATARQLHPAPVPRVLVLGPVLIKRLPDGVEAVDKLVEVATYIAPDGGAAGHRVWLGGGGVDEDHAVELIEQAASSAATDLDLQLARFAG